MPKYYGCPCEGCGNPLTLTDDIVVCPDCGAPYHRSCYKKLGQCIHSTAHSAGYEWQFPYKDDDLRTCPHCGEKTLRSEEKCRCCGKISEAGGLDDLKANNEAHDTSSENTFDYASLYSQADSNIRDTVYQAWKKSFGSDDKLDGISCSDWMDYIGPAGPAYMADYCRMQLRKSKISMSFSALLFGPFYFFYRKAWKPAFAFLTAELLLSLPTLINMMQISGSALAPNISDSALIIIARVCSALSFVLMVVRGMFGKWLYRRSAAERIRRIEKEFPDQDKRRAVLSAQGGVSVAAVFGAFVLLLLIGSASSLLLGPDIEALLAALY